MIRKSLDFVSSIFTSPLKRYIQWAEFAAYEDDIAAHHRSQRPLPDNAPLTLDRIANISWRFFLGSRQNDALITRNFRMLRNRSKSSEDIENFVTWLLTGIAFRKGLRLGMKAGMMLFGTILSIPGALIGGLTGSIVGACAAGFARYQGQTDPMAISITTGAKVGSRIGARFAGSIGFGIGAIPGVIVGSAGGLAAAAIMGVIGVVASIAVTARFLFAVGRVVFNPWAWQRGARNVKTYAIDTTDAFKTWVKSIYVQESAEYYRSQETIDMHASLQTPPLQRVSPEPRSDSEAGSPLLTQRDRSMAISRASAETYSPQDPGTPSPTGRNDNNHPYVGF